MDSLTLIQHNAVAFAMQAAVAAAGGAALFFFARLPAIQPRCQAAVALLAVAAAVAAGGAYAVHAQWRAAWTSAVPFDDAARFASAALATPALVAALVLVLNLPARKAWLHGGVLALVSAQMAVLAYPGASTVDMDARWAALGLCLVPFGVLVVQLNVLLAGAMAAQPRAVRPWVLAARHAIVVSWLAQAALHALPLAGIGATDAFAVAQAGGALVDGAGLILCGLLIYNAAAVRSRRWTERRATAAADGARSAAASGSVALSA